MRSLTAVLYLSLDGVMENPAWTAPYFNDELAAAQRELLFAHDALLLGRVTYEAFAQAWPAATDEDGFAARMNALPKYVASRTLAPSGWNAQPLPGPDAAPAVTTLKQQPGGDLLLYGSGELADALRQHNLIDEYRLLVFPMVLGQGRRFFREGSAPTNLRLVEARTTRTGVSLLTYRPATT